jgi:hypothetical protein
LPELPTDKETRVDINKLSTPEKIISVSGIVLFIASFLPWFKVSVSGFGSASGNGWDVGFLWGGIPTLIGMVMVAHVLISNFAENVKLPEAPWAKIHMIGGIIAAVLVVLKLLIGESDEGIVGVEVSRQFGLFLATLAAIGLGAGGFLYNKEHAGATGPATTM